MYYLLSRTVDISYNNGLYEVSVSHHGTGTVEAFLSLYRIQNSLYPYEVYVIVIPTLSMRK